MKKISEMSLEELQDYALTLEGKVTEAEGRITSVEAEKQNLVELNQALQKRNNDLFMRVENQVKNDPQPEKTPEQVETCEEFANRLILGGK